MEQAFRYRVGKKRRTAISADSGSVAMTALVVTLTPLGMNPSLRKLEMLALKCLDATRSKARRQHAVVHRRNRCQRQDLGGQGELYSDMTKKIDGLGAVFSMDLSFSGENCRETRASLIRVVLEEQSEISGSVIPLEYAGRNIALRFSGLSRFRR